MSELPVASESMQETTQENAPYYYLTSTEFARSINVHERETVDESIFQLDKTEPLNPEIWDATVEVTAAPDYSGLNHTEQLAKAYEFMNLKQIIDDITAVSEGVITLRGLQQRDSN